MPSRLTRILRCWLALFVLTVNNVWGILPYQPEVTETPACELRKLRRHGRKFCAAGRCPVCAKGLCRQAGCGKTAR